MPRGVKKFKEPKQTQLPPSIQDRQLLDSILNEIVEHKSKAKYYLDLAKGAKEVLTDPEGRLNLDSKYVSKLIKAKVDLWKTEREAEGLQSSVDDVKVLGNSNSQE